MPKFSGEGRLGLLMEIAVIILDRVEIRAAYIIWPLFIMGALLIADAIWRGEWAQKHSDTKALRKRRILYACASGVSLSVLGIWLVHRTQSLQKQTESMTTFHDGAGKENKTRQTTKTLETQPPEEKPLSRARLDKKADEKPRQSTEVGPIAIAPYGIANAAPNFGTQTVNNAPPPRILDVDNLRNCVSKRPGRFSVMAVMGNQEAFDFAKSWLNLLTAAGWTNERPATAPIGIFMIGGGMWSGVRFKVHGAKDDPNSTEILPDSIEMDFCNCLSRFTRTRGTIIPYHEIQTGTVQIEVSTQP